MKRNLKLGIITSVLAFVAFFLFFGGGRQAAASAQGPSPSHTDAPGEDNCTSCHITYPVNSGGGSVQIIGVPPVYTPGQQYSLSVKAAQDDAIIFGFQMTAVDGLGSGAGTFSVPGGQRPTMKVLNGSVQGKSRQYVEHTVDGLFTSGVFGSNTWTFTWTAPSQAVGPVTFYAAGNAANSNNAPSGDHIYTVSAVTNSTASSVSISGRVFTASGQGLRNATIRLTDQNGVARTTLTSSLGYYSFTEVPAGVTYTLSANSKRYKFQSKNLTPSDNLTNQDFTGIE